MIDVILPVLDEADAIPWVLARMPDGYRPIIRPEYPWSYFEERDKRAEIDRGGYDRTARRDFR